MSNEKLTFQFIELDNEDNIIEQEPRQIMNKYFSPLA